MTDPCAASTAEALVFRDSTNAVVSSTSVTDGNSVVITIDAPTNSFATSEGVSDRCGTMSAAVYTNNDGSDTSPNNNWAAMTGPDFSTGAYTLTIDTSLDQTLIDNESTIAIVIYVKTTIVDYNSQTQYSSFTVNIGEATCDCTALLWANPSMTSVSIAVGSTDTPTIPVPTADTTNRSTNTAFDKCYVSGNDCAVTGSFSASDVKYVDGSASGAALPSWITITSTGTETQTISLAPTDGTHEGTH